MRSLSPAERVQVKFECQHCKAKPGDWCVTVSGKQAALLHASRYKQAYAAGELPITDWP